MTNNAYDDLELHFQRIAHLESAKAVLQWDSATMMPKGGAIARSSQLATLDSFIHDRLTDPHIEELISKAKGADIDSWGERNLELMERRWYRANAVPVSLVEALTLACVSCETCWRNARQQNDYASLVPLLSEVVSLTRERAAALSDALNLTLYDALLDEYDPGCSVTEVDGLFSELRNFLPTLTNDVLVKQEKQVAPHLLNASVPIVDQQRLAKLLMAQLGLEDDHSRLDISCHPFSGGVPDDVRITTRYNVTNFSQGLLGVLHETGHALYERGLPADWRGQPVGEAHGMAIHESQSLLIEMQVSRSWPFLSFLTPKLREVFSDADWSYETKDLGCLWTRVKPGLIRVDADELTYPSHIMLRYELERQMIDGALDPIDLPEAWSAGMREHLGIVPNDDKDGCMQDIHWYAGDFGYFPTYTIGAVAAAQFFAAAIDQVPQIPSSIGRGDFSLLLQWLRRNIHSCGSLFDRDQLLHRATGRTLETFDFERHLRKRYLDS